MGKDKSTTTEAMGSRPNKLERAPMRFLTSRHLSISASGSPDIIVPATHKRFDTGQVLAFQSTPPGLPSPDGTWVDSQLLGETGLDRTGTPAGQGRPGARECAACRGRVEEARAAQPGGTTAARAVGGATAPLRPRLSPRDLCRADDRGPGRRRGDCHRTPDGSAAIPFR